MGNTQKKQGGTQPLPLGWIQGQTSDSWYGLHVRDYKKQLDEKEKSCKIPDGYEALPLEEERHITFAYFIAIVGKEREAAFAYAHELVCEIKTKPTLGDVQHIWKKKGENGQTYDVNCFVVKVHWPELEEAYAKFDQRFPANTTKVDNPPRFRPHITLYHLQAKK